MTTSFTRRAALAAGLALTLGAAVPALAQQNQVIRVGVSPGPHAEILEKVKPLLAKQGIDLKIIEFSDYVVPNQALDAGELEANSFQHKPYLDNQVKDRGFRIETVGLTVNFPLGIYSSKYKNWSEVPDGATVAIQNDPTNGGRSLLLLQDKGVIKLKDGVGFKPTVADITANPKKLKIIEIEAAQTPRSLDAAMDRSEDDHSLGDTMPDDLAVDPTDTAQAHQVERLVGGWIDALTHREKEVLEGRFGLHDREPETLEVLSDRLGLTRERVRQIQNEALVKLKRQLTRGGIGKEAFL